MVSLQDFHTLPKAGNVSICERDARVCSMPSSEVDLSIHTTGNLVSTFVRHFFRQIAQMI